MKDQIVLFLSEIKEPFVRHDIAILSLPNGLLYHFRYRTANLESKVVADFLSDEGIEGSFGIFALIDFSNDSFIPIRSIIIRRVERYGDYLSLELEMGDFVKCDIPNSILPNDNKILSYSNFIESNGKNPSIEQPSNGKDPILIRLINTPPTEHLETVPYLSAENYFRNWGNIVRLLSNRNEFKDYTFYNIAVVKSLNNDRLILPQKIFGSKRGYKFIGGKTYRMGIMHLSGQDISGNQSLAFRVNSDHITSYTNRLLLDGTYDLSEYIFVPKRQLASNIESIMFVNIENESNRFDSSNIEKSLGGYLPTIQVPIKIIWGFEQVVFKIVFPVLLFLISGSIFMFSNNLAETSTLKSWKIDSEMIKNFSILLFGLTFAQLGSLINLVRKISII